MEPDITSILDNYSGAGRDQLIPLLQDVQEQCGYISKEAVDRIGERLALPPSKVYGVATFYNQFRFRPPGRYHVQVCRGTACHVKGSARVLESLQAALGIGPGETTRDGLFSLEVVACIGACGLAPVIVVDGEFHAGVTPEAIESILDHCRKRAETDDQND